MGDPTWKKKSRKGLDLLLQDGAWHPVIGLVATTGASTDQKPCQCQSQHRVTLEVFCPISDLASCLSLSLHDKLFFCPSKSESVSAVCKKKSWLQRSVPISLSINIVFLSPSNQSLSGKVQLSHKVFIITPLYNVSWDHDCHSVHCEKLFYQLCRGHLYGQSLTNQDRRRLAFWQLR